MIYFPNKVICLKIDYQEKMSFCSGLVYRFYNSKLDSNQILQKYDNYFLFILAENYNFSLQFFRKI